MAWDLSRYGRDALSASGLEVISDNCYPSYQNGRADFNRANAHFPKFVHRLSTHLSRTSESHGHWQTYDSSAALLFEVPERYSPLAVQELQIGGTSVRD
jgi:hypothetical protein